MTGMSRSREVAVHVQVEGAGMWRQHRLRLELPGDASEEDVLAAVAEEFARRDADFYARQGRLPL